jgi:hypothetical protein
MAITLDEFNKLPVTIKGFSVSVVLLTPFWYLDLYLFKRGFVSHDYVQLIPSIAAFCLSIAWCTAVLICMIGIVSWQKLLGKHVTADSKTITFNLLSVSAIMSLLYSVSTLSLYTYFSYRLGQKSFIYFVKWAFISLACFFFSMLVFIWLINFIDKKYLRKSK